MIDKISVQDCTLCGSCVNACPTDAISFSKAYLDFCYPEINAALCVRCGQCEKACPLLGAKKRPADGYPLAFAAKSDNEQIRLRSSSGGIFYELANQMLHDGGYICGAVFDGHFHVRHIVSNTRKYLFRMMGSKYAQSDMGYCYREIKEKLKAGEKVLFSGCPCQVAGLRTYLGEDYQNLLLVELICHGIPSDQMLQTYISMQEKRYGAKLKRMEFRNKAKGWHNSSVRMEFENGKTYLKPMTIDTYMQGYFRGVSLKEGCFSCKFRNFASGGDLIIGDFWGSEIEVPDIDDNKGISVVIATTQKGNVFFRKTAIPCYRVELINVLKYNQGVIKSFCMGSMRSDFYKYAKKYSLKEAIGLFFQEKTTQKVKRKIRYALHWALHIVQGKGKPLY